MSKLIDKALKQDGKEIDEFSNTFDTDVDEFNRLVLIGAVDVSDDISISDTSLFVEEAMRGSGYYITLNIMLNNEFQKVVVDEMALLEKITKQTIKFGEGTKKTLMDMKELTLQQFSEVTRNIQNKVSQQIYQFFRGNITKTQLTGSLKDITDQFKAWTNTWVDTSIAGFKRETYKQLSIDNSINKHQYYNPIDSLTRPFCRTWNGIVKTFAEWDKLSNGQIYPVSVYMGGYNCRGRWIAV